MIASRIVIVLVVAAICAATTLAQPRNVVMIVADDQRPDAINALGNAEVDTPNLDRLVHNGVAFTNAYCLGSRSGAVCAPSRAMFLTGKTLFRFGPGPFNTGPEHVMLPQVLRGEGYTTFGTGKWHNGKGSFARSFDAGGSIFFGGMGSHTDLRVFDFDQSGAYPNENRRTLREFSSTEFVSAGVGFLESSAATDPFFLYISFTAPHDPRTPPAEDAARYPADAVTLPPNAMPAHPFHNGEMEIRDERLAPWPREPEVVRTQLGEYYAMITQMDRQIGRVLDTLEAEGLSDETLVVFFADHGLGVGSHGLMGKQNLYEHSMGAPLIVSGPGVVRGVRSDAPVYLHDIPATVCDMLGLDGSWASESVSFAPALRGEAFAGHPSVYTAYRDMQRAVRVGDWKLIRYTQINRTQLFNLASDPHEINDLSGDPAHADRIIAMLGELGRWQERLDDPVPLSAEEPKSDVFDPVAAERRRTGG